MRAPKRSIHLTVCFAIILALGCAKSDNQAADTAGAGAMDVAADQAGLSAADLAGRWNTRALPFSGGTTPVTSVLVATNNNSGWTLSFPNRPPIATRVTFDADSVMTESGPYESVLRKGVQVMTTGVYRLQNDTIVGISVARYSTRGVDSVMRFRVTGTRAP